MADDAKLVAAEVADEVAALARRATAEGLTMLAYLLDCVRLEAESVLKSYGPRDDV